MTKSLQLVVMLASLSLLMAGLSFAESSGGEIYRAKCFKCHGATGLADTSMGKALKVKPIHDPSVRNMSLSEMIAATRNGMGKMQAYKGSLTEAEIKSSTEYFRTFLSAK